MDFNPDSPIYQQYLLEKELAKMLMSASKENRKKLYSKVYDRFLRELPPSRKELLKQNSQQRQFIVNLKMTALESLISSKEDCFLEIGAGNCDLSLYMAKKVKRVFAIEASMPELDVTSIPLNVTLNIADSPPYGLDPFSIDVAFSSHFVEHLHPEDLKDHLLEVFRILKSGGRYLCITPNAIYGPHDISQYFEEKVPTGLHLKEYSYASLALLMRKSGFKNIQAMRHPSQKPSNFSLYSIVLQELMILTVPHKWRSKLIKNAFPSLQKPFRPLEQVTLVGYK